MKTVIIHGQSHNGSTYHIAHKLAEKISGEIKEFSCQEISGNFVWDAPTALWTQKRSAHIMNPCLQLHKQWMQLM